MKKLVLTALLAGAATGAMAADAAGLEMAKKNGCVACHGLTNKIVGPGFNEIAAKYKGNAAAEKDLVGKVKGGTKGAWGAIPMPPQIHVKEDEIKSIVSWILASAR